MTILMGNTDRVNRFTGMPGWDIVGDLTPPELLELRSFAVLRRRIVLVLVLVLVLCAAGFGYATVLRRGAEDESARADQRSVALHKDVAKYAGITQIEKTLSTIEGQQATVLSNDVNVPKSVAMVREALPVSMSIETLSVTITGDPAAGAPTGTSGSSATGLDTSGHPTIGTVTISGSGQSLDDLPRFVDRLSAVRGFVDVLPTSNQAEKSTSQFSLTLSLTDLLLTHDYDVQAGDK